MRKGSIRKRDNWREVVRRAVRAAVDKQALDLVILDVSKLTDITSYFVIASGRTDRQVEAIVDGVEEVMDAAGDVPLGVEGKQRGGWVLVDYGGVIIHVFTPEVREYYRLESLWIGAPTVDPEELLRGE